MSDEQQSEEQQRGVLRRLGPAGILAVVAATLPAIGGFVLLGFVGTVGARLKDLGTAGLALYVGAFALTSGFALLPTYAQAFLGGWAFGVAFGLPGALAGITIGAVIGYVIGRRASGDRIVDLVEEHPKARAVASALIGQGFWKTLGIVTLLRIPPNSPFAMMNLVMASVKVPLGTYIVGTAVGITPRTAVAVVLASRIADELTKETIKDANPKFMIVGGIVVAVVVIVIIGQIANKAIERVVARSDDDHTVEEQDDQV